MAESPLICIRLSSGIVDEIQVYHEPNCGWKIDGSKGGQSVRSLDQLQDDFATVVGLLAAYWDETSVWVLSPEMRELSPFQALTLLALGNDTSAPVSFGSC
jgi:hypothetical protein